MIMTPIADEERTFQVFGVPCCDEMDRHLDILRPGVGGPAIHVYNGKLLGVEARMAFAKFNPRFCPFCGEEIEVVNEFKTPA